ncbi:MAG: CAP domain-containing protein [Oceanipulchritudo sp.]
MLASLVLLLPCRTDALSPASLLPGQQAAPPAAPPVTGDPVSYPSSSLLPGDRHSIGSPTDEEQAFVEYINRARADANAEALRLGNTSDPDVVSAINFFDVDILQMYAEFATLDQNLPPLSINENLTTAARLHSEDMFTNVFQEHTSSSNPPAPFEEGDGIGERIQKSGYSFSIAAENIYSYAKSAFHGHAAFNIDWGFGPDADGMQDPPGHRLNIHSPNYREIGVGVVLGTNTAGTTTVGPLIVTQDFAETFSPVPFITGVAYFDLNENAFYDIGEGLGGLTVEVAEAVPWAETANSGGYSVPVTGDGTYNVTFSGLGLTAQTTPVAVSGNLNVKLDLALPYTAPQITGPVSPVTNTDNLYTATSTIGATEYLFRLMTEDTSPWVEGAENGTDHLTIINDPLYTVIQSDIVNSGSYTFHLVHPDGFSEEIIQLNDVFLISGSSELQFASRLQYAGFGEYAKVDISPDEGMTWINIYSQRGTNSSGEASFVNRSLPLGDYADKLLMVRFRYSYMNTSDSYYPSTQSYIGWLIDDITITSASRTTSMSDTTDPLNEYTFHPTANGDHVLMARPINNGRLFPFGPPYRVTASDSGASPLQLWREAHFSPADLADPLKEASIWGNDADPEHDGFNNLMEFALNGDPNLPDAGAIAPVFTRDGGTLKLSYTMNRSDVTYRVLTNTVLEGVGWTTSGVIQTPDPDTATEGTLIEATSPLDGQQRFLRLEVTMP